METLEDMRLFKTVMEAGSLSAAGRLTGQSPASVSRKIVRLERAVGAKLLIRTSRSLSLTSMGEIYLGRVSVILDQIDNLKTAISEQQTVPRGALHIHTSSAINDYFLADALPSFLMKYPEIVLDADFSDDEVDLSGSATHVDIRIGMPHDPELMIRRLSQGTERILYASRAYLDRMPGISSVEQLSAHKFVLPSSISGDQTRLLCRSGAGIVEMPIHGNLLVNDTRALHRAALGGLGLALLPAWMVAKDLASGTIVRLLPNVEITSDFFEHGLFAVFRRSDLILPKVRVFLDFLVETFRQRDPEISRIDMEVRRHSAQQAGHPPDAMRWVHGFHRR